MHGAPPDHTVRSANQSVVTLSSIMCTIEKMLAEKGDMNPIVDVRRPCPRYHTDWTRNL
jgi:hypothetical protein